jgi:predicted phage tail protein
VRLYGLAKKKYGASFLLEVASLGEAVRALSVQLEGFREFLEKHNFHVVWGKDRTQGLVLGQDDVHLMLGKKGDIHIMPILKGNKKGGLIKIIAGVFLLATAFFVPMALGGATTMASTFGLGGMTYGNLAVLGLGLIAAGVSQMLTSNKKADDKKDDSFMIDGQLNVTEQGGGVPVPYGRIMVGSVLMSAGMSTVDIAIPNQSSK